ncbi:MAG: sel1 repeat family protein [Rhodospirillales bacterium]|nr:sel1 repeat family protein [Rhodospirillales bacterium]
MIKISKLNLALLIAGILFTIASAVLSVDVPSAFTAAALLGIITIKLLISALILGCVAFVIGALRKKPKQLWFPIFAWFLCIVGLVDLSASAYNDYVLKPRLMSTLSQAAENDALNNAESKASQPKDLFEENPEILFKMAYQYMRGDGVPQSHEKSLEFLIKAAESGHAEAQYNLGSMYINGVGFEQDREKGMSWLKRAKENGSSEAADLLVTVEFSNLQQTACYHEDELLAEILNNFMFAQNDTAIKCDQLLATNSYSDLSMSISKMHIEQIKEFGKPLTKFAERNGLDTADFLILKQMQISESLKSYSPNQEECAQFLNELEQRKDWTRIRQSILGSYVMFSENYNICERGE